MDREKHIKGHVFSTFGGTGVSGLAFVPDYDLRDTNALTFRHNGTRYAVHLTNDKPLVYDKQGQVLEQIKKWVDNTEQKSN